MAVRKRPKRKSPGARTPRTPRAARGPRTGDADRSAFASTLRAALNGAFDEVDRFAEAIAKALGLRDERVSSAKGRAR